MRSGTYTVTVEYADGSLWHKIDTHTGVISFRQPNTDDKWLKVGDVTYAIRFIIRIAAVFVPDEEPDAETV